MELNIPVRCTLQAILGACCYKYVGALHQKENYLKAAINPKYPGALHLTDTVAPCCYKYAGAQHQKENI